MAAFMHTQHELLRIGFHSTIRDTAHADDKSGGGGGGDETTKSSSTQQNACPLSKFLLSGDYSDCVITTPDGSVAARGHAAPPVRVRLEAVSLSNFGSFAAPVAGPRGARGVRLVRGGRVDGGGGGVRGRGRMSIRLCKFQENE